MMNMKKLRRILLWVTVIGTANMVQLCGLTAYLGVEHTWILFNSHAGMLMWIGLTGLLVAGLVLFPRLARRPGLLTMHVACVLILIGAMMSSQEGMSWLDRFSKRKRIYKAYMRLGVGQRSRSVTDRKGQPYDELPFEVECKQFRMEYYPYKKDEFKFVVVVDEEPRKTGRWHGGREKTTHETDSKRFKCELGPDGKAGPWKDLPLCDDIRIRLTGLEIQPPVKEPFLLFSIGDGHDHEPTEISPIEEGSECRIDMHRMQLICTVASTYRAFWAPDPRDPRRRIIRRDEKLGKFPAADIDISVVDARLWYAYTKKLATELGSEAEGMYKRLRYVPRADAEAETGQKSDGPLIVAFPPNVEEKVFKPAKVGSRFVFEAGPGGMKFGRVKAIMTVKVVDDPTPLPPGSPPDAPKRRTWVKDDGPDAQPMAVIEVLTPQGQVTAYTPATRAQMQDPDRGGIVARYIPPDDPVKQKGLQRPRVTFEVKRGIHRGERTVTILKKRGPRTVRLAFLYGPFHEKPKTDEQIAENTKTLEAWEEANSPRIYVNDEPPQKELISDLVIRRNGRVVARKSIEMNHPLHYGGYHISQADPDYANQAWTALTIKSDSGWTIVLAGMILLMAGTFLHFWFEPIWKARRRRGSNDSDDDDEAADDAAQGPEQEAGE